MSTPPEGWTPVERQLWHALRDGVALDLTKRPDDCGTPVVGAAGVEVSASVLVALLLQPPTPAAGVVARLRLTGAGITGRLRLRHAEIRTPIELINCRLDQPVELDHAAIRAADFTGCHMPELHADGLQAEGDLILTRLTSGKVSLFKAQIGGNLWLDDARVHSGEAGVAVHGAQLRIDGGLYADALHAAGTVNLWGAHAFSVELGNAHLAGTNVALRADGLTVAQDLHCSNVAVHGGIQLFAATIGGQLWLNNAEVHSTAGWAINAPTLTVAGGIYGRGLTAPAGVNLFAADVGESIELPAATLGTAHRPALRAPGVRIRGDLTLADTTQLVGDLDLTRAEIRGTLNLASAKFDSETRIDLRYASIGKLNATPLDPPPAALDLRTATIATIHGEPGNWPQQIAFDMLTYQALDPVLPAKERLAWLARDGGGYHPQPYEQLAAHYRQLGHDNDARAVLLTRHRRRRRTLGRPGRMWGYVEDITVGYGYLPARALGWLLAVTAALAIVFAVAPPQPVQPDSRHFHPVAYALDLILPIVGLGQENSFVPTGNTQWIAWAGTVAGWLLATTVVAGVTRRLTGS